MDTRPKADEFVRALSPFSRWFTLGIYLGVPDEKLRFIERNHSNDEDRVLIEIYSDLERRGKLPSWDRLVGCLTDMEENTLAMKIQKEYIRARLKRKHSQVDTDIATDTDVTDDITRSLKASRLEDSPKQESRVPLTHDEAAIKRTTRIANEYHELDKRLNYLISDIKDFFRKSDVQIIEKLQDYIEHQYNLVPLPTQDATVNAIFSRIRSNCNISILNFELLSNVFKHMNSLTRTPLGSNLII